eukprot:4357030-Pleurochrysis_carterae.AAC.2
MPSTLLQPNSTPKRLHRSSSRASCRSQRSSQQGSFSSKSKSTQGDEYGGMGDPDVRSAMQVFAEKLALPLASEVEVLELAEDSSVSFTAAELLGNELLRDTAADVFDPGSDEEALDFAMPLSSDKDAERANADVNNCVSAEPYYDSRDMD